MQNRNICSDILNLKLELPITRTWYHIKNKQKHENVITKNANSTRHFVCFIFRTSFFLSEFNRVFETRGEFNVPGLQFGLSGASGVVTVTGIQKSFVSVMLAISIGNDGWWRLLVFVSVNASFWTPTKVVGLAPHLLE